MRNQIMSFSRCFRLEGNPRAMPIVSHLDGEHLGIPQEELEDVAGENNIWTALLSLLPPENRLEAG